jgi:8-oxo-dGTP pyrophosphatase MutT (NUDIX family)
VILLNAAHQILLIRYVTQRGELPFVFWATPGGGVEPGESDNQAARRELIEELGLDLPLAGPIHSVTSEFVHEGVPTASTDVFFLGHCPRSDLTLGFASPAELAAMTGFRWWSIDEIESAAETIFPVDLAEILRAKAAVSAVTRILTGL